MAFLHCLSFSTPLFLPRRRSSLSSSNLAIFPKLRLRNFGNSLPLVACSSRQSTPATEQDILEAVETSDGRSLPCVRTYENDLARLTVVGTVDFEQALTAAAADGGEAASEHISAGMPAMVVETVYPGLPDEHGTVSTRLFLPASKVKEKAKKLKTSLSEDIFSNTTSRNILAMTFRQVVLENLWNFELLLFRPGAERNMEELGNAREVPASFAISSSNEHIISLLGDVVCHTALESTERDFLHNSRGRPSNNYIHWLQKHKRIASRDSSIAVHKLFEDEIVANAKDLLETYISKKANYKPVRTNLKSSWWTLSAYSKMEMIGGAEFSTWISEYAPAYQLEIDTNKIHNVKLEGWKQSSKSRWEVLLTHSQMVGLANILDMYYEDLYTLPGKQLSCGVITKPTNFSTNERMSSLLKLLSTTLASGFLIVIISIIGQVCLPYLHIGRKYPGANQSFQSSKIVPLQHQAVESAKLEDLCISLIKKIKEAFGWTGDITAEKGVGAWIGELPSCLRRMLGGADCSIGEITSDSAAALMEGSGGSNASTQDIASYEVVLSSEGNVVGFQPTSRVAVNHWASNPLARELYGGRKLSPGFIEPGLKRGLPSEIVVIELLMSVNPEFTFALARPVG